MSLSNLKSAWQQIKMINALHPVESAEILSIIESSDSKSSKWQKVFYSLAMFIVLALFCQGG